MQGNNDSFKQSWKRVDMKYDDLAKITRAKSMSSVDPSAHFLAVKEHMEENDLLGDVDSLIRYFDLLGECVESDLCEKEIIRNTRSRDAWWLFDIYGPYINFRRTRDEPAYGKGTLYLSRMTMP
jgi:hypothetical protein